MNENTTPPPLAPEKKDIHTELPDKPGVSQLFEALLKSPFFVLEHLRNKSGAIPALSIISLLSFLIFGLLLGSFSGGTQFWAAPTKVLVGLLLSCIICFPSLYIFTALTGANLRLTHVARSLLASITLIAILLVGFAPVVWVFTQSSDSLGFVGAIVIAVWLIAVGFGAGLLKKMLKIGNATTTSPLTIWVFIFLLVTLQMSTSLRPIIGSSDTLITSEKRFFLEHWIQSMDESTSTKSSLSR